MRVQSRRGFLLSGLLLLAPALMATDPDSVRREVYLMGTVATFDISTSDSAEGLHNLELLIRFLEDQEKQLSTWKPTSGWSHVNQQPIGIPLRLDPQQCALFGQLRRWSLESGGAFDPAIGQLMSAWDLRGKGKVPSAEELEVALAESGVRQFAFDESLCQLTRRSEVLVDCGSFGKGEALDRMARHAEEQGLAGWTVNLGGQVMVQRSTQKAETVTIAHPADRFRAWMSVVLSRGSLATSGVSERARTVGDYRVGHILDPRTGRPARFGGSVTVWSESARDADILSTVLFVLGPEEGVPWAEARSVAACYLIPQATGKIECRMTTGFTNLRPKLVEQEGICLEDPGHRSGHRRELSEPLPAGIDLALDQ